MRNAQWCQELQVLVKMVFSIFVFVIYIGHLHIGRKRKIIVTLISDTLDLIPL